MKDELTELLNSLEQWREVDLSSLSDHKLLNVFKATKDVLNHLEERFNKHNLSKFNENWPNLLFMGLNEETVTLFMKALTENQLMIKMLEKEITTRKCNN